MADDSRTRDPRVFIKVPFRVRYIVVATISVDTDVQQDTDVQRGELLYP